MGETELDTIHLKDIRDCRFVLKSPIEVVFRKSGNRLFEAEATELRERGYGTSKPAALKDLQAQLVTVYVWLEDNEAVLNDTLREQWATMQRKVFRKS